MTDYCGVMVTFEKDIRSDDANAIMEAIRQLRGVVNVKPVEADPSAERVLKMRIRNNLFVAMRDELFGGGK